jgi:hypothetical protein
MHMADRVRMCIDMGIGIDRLVTVATRVFWFMARAYKTKPAGWVAQVGGCWSIGL